MQAIIRMVEVLPAPFGPEEPVGLAPADLEVDAVDGDEVAEALGEARAPPPTAPTRRRARVRRAGRIGR